jgi:hypothetical protein
MKTKEQKLELSTAFNLLNAKSKSLIKIHIQKSAGWSDATFYHKIKSDENLNPLEYNALYLIIKKEIADTIYDLQDLIHNLQNLNNL